MTDAQNRSPEQPDATEPETEATRSFDDAPGMLDDIPPTGDLTPGQAASRAEGPGIRQDPPDGPLVVDEAGAVVDTGSPQDYGEPNDDLERPGN